MQTDVNASLLPQKYSDNCTIAKTCDQSPFIITTLQFCVLEKKNQKTCTFYPERGKARA